VLDYPRYFDVEGPRVSGFARNMLGYPVNAQYWDAGTGRTSKVR
jgi:hypothetical protein